MSGAIDRKNSILGNGIIEHLDSGHVEVFSDTSGITLTGASGNICYKISTFLVTLIFLKLARTTFRQSMVEIL